MGGREGTDRIKTPSVHRDPSARVPNIPSNIASACLPQLINKKKKVRPSETII